MHFLVDRHRTAAVAQRRLQNQMASAPGDDRQIRPVHQQNRPTVSGQSPGGERLVENGSFDMKMAVAEQPIDALDVVTRGAAPGQMPTEIGKRQSLTVEQGADGKEQRSKTAPVHERTGGLEPSVQ